MPQVFTPSSSKLLAMIAAAEAKCDADVEQAGLRKEAAEEGRMERFLCAEAKAKQWRRSLDAYAPKTYFCKDRYSGGYELFANNKKVGEVATRKEATSWWQSQSI
jgi:hypothetical protein